ncbi:MAG: hypothetical protein L0Y79_13140 [Chlorobi bacterium]|nr:hypothetical protein [Chlorobiota bacterium]MCI0715125.1 hypothetical protein [Chlorobiota bacterium]
MKSKFWFLALFFLAASVVFAQKTQTYLIISSHTVEQCMASMDDLKAKGNDFLSKTYWGCHSGDHTAYVIVDAESEAAARNTLPASAKDNAKVIAVEKFTVEQIESMHKHDK